MYEEARQWRDRGYVPIPMIYRSKKPRFPWGPWLSTQELPVDKVLQMWFSGVWNIGVVLRGDQVVVDFDDIAKYRDWRNEHGLQAMTTFTSRGAHVWMRCAGDLVGMKVDGADLLRNHLVVVPPSVHATGVRYQLIDGPIPVVEEVPGARRAEISPLERKQKLESVGGTAIAAIKQMMPIEVYLSRMTKVAATNARYAKAVCPFHNDHDPSLSIDMENGRCKCYAGCTHGWIDVIDVRCMVEGIDVKTAIYRFAVELGY